MDLHITIIGAGVVGLAIAAELSKKHENIFVFEKNSGFGQETSSRNSEVIHSGIYYPQNSLKTELCSVGNRLLYDWCDSYRVPYQKIGKFIIAINEEDCENLQLLFNNGIKNNIPGLKLVTSEEFTEIEPKIKAKKAIFSETTGIVDSHSLMASFEAYASNNGATFAYNHQINNISKIKGGYNLKILSGNETFFYTSEIVINAAGLMADKIAALPGINPDEADYQLSYAKGHYFRLKPGMSNLAEHLIYPVPQKNWIYREVSNSVLIYIICPIIFWIILMSRELRRNLLNQFIVMLPLLNLMTFRKTKWEYGQNCRKKAKVSEISLSMKNQIKVSPAFGI